MTNRTTHESEPGRGPAGTRAIPTRIEILFLAAAAAVLIGQLFLPPFIGLASNGDFSKVTGRLSLGPKNGSADDFVYFTSDYVYSPKYHWESQVLSSELILARAATMLGRVFGAREEFDIRYLGAIHSILFLTAYGLLLVFLRPMIPAVRVAVSAAALWIFTDVAYLAYFNSFYSDAAALLGLLLLLALALPFLTGPPVSAPRVALFGLAALLFISSKAQHGFYGFIPALFALLPAWSAKRAWTRLVGSLVCVVLLAASVWVVRTTPASYKAEALFNLVFFKLTKYSTTPLEDLKELGLGEQHLQYIGMHAFLPHSPTNDKNWAQEFYRRSGYSKLAGFYFRHPRRALAILAGDLRTEAFQIRAFNLANHRRADGYPSYALANRFAFWSRLRSTLFYRWPGHILAWYAMLLAATIRMIYQGGLPLKPGGAWICLSMTTMAILEYGTTSLADACETYRHLLLFHALTDLTVCLALASVMTSLAVASRRPLVKAIALSLHATGTGAAGPLRQLRREHLRRNTVVLALIFVAAAVALAWQARVAGGLKGSRQGEAYGAPVRLSFAPSLVGRGERYTITCSELAGRRIDLQYVFANRTMEALDFCLLDSAGSATIRVPESLEPGTVEVAAVRASGAPLWRPTKARITVR